MPLFYYRNNLCKLITFTLFLLFNFVSNAQTWIRCSNGLPRDTAVSSLTKIGNTLFAGTEHAGIYKSIDQGNTWITTGFYTPVRISIAKCMTSIDTFVFAGLTGNGVFRTTINGNGWTEMNNGIPKGNGNQAIFDLITVGNTLYAAANGGGVYVSTDLGESWTKLYNNLGLNDPHCLSLAANNQFLFTGTVGSNYTMPDTGVVFVTPLVNGTSWSVMNNGLSRNGAHLEAISGMTASDSVVYAGTDDVGIHRSTDNGNTWIPVPGTELNGDIWSIKIIGDLVYYGTLYHGIFTSDDSGHTFSINNNGLNYQGISIPDLVDDFVVLEPYIYAATTTGVYKQLLNQTTSLHAAPDKSVSMHVTVEPNPFSEETVLKINPEIKIDDITIRIIDMYGRVVRSISVASEENGGRIKIKREGLAQGIYFYSIFMKEEIIYGGKLIVK
jgi:photosystem II stability/assembly factor-like uncharacterized protein